MNEQGCQMYSIKQEDKIYMLSNVCIGGERVLAAWRLFTLIKNIHVPWIILYYIYMDYCL